MDYVYRPVTIRLARPEDAPGMAEVIMRSWEAAYEGIIPGEYIREKNATRPAQYKRSMTDENKNSYVMVRDGKIAGVMRIAPPQDEDALDDWYELHYIYLHPDYFRSGIGTQSVEFAFNLARGIGKRLMVDRGQTIRQNPKEH